MRKKLVRVLIVAKDMKLANQILWKVRETIPQPLKILREIKFDVARDIIERGMADIFVIGTKLLEGDGEDLIKLIRKLYPEHLIIIHLENDDVHYQLNLYKKYRNIICISKNELFEGLTTPLLDAHINVERYKSHKLVFPTITININDVSYITTSKNMIYIEVYDWEKEKFYCVSRKMSMTGFLEEYNGDSDFIRCHGSYIVNKRMIERIDPSGDYLVLVPRLPNGNEIPIPISDTYRANFPAQWKGMC